MEARRTAPEVFRGSIFASGSISFSKRNALTDHGLSAAGRLACPPRAARASRGCGAARKATEEENAARLCI